MPKKIIITILFSMALVFSVIHGTNAIVVGASPQTLTIIGSQGAVGDTDPYTEFTLDNGQTWRRAYLYGSHPWGFVEGTNSWLNCGPTGFHCLGIDIPYRVQFILPDDFTNPQTTFQFNADNAVTIHLNNTFVSNITSSGTVNGDSTINSALKPGLNEVQMLLRDQGGWTGLNFKVTIRVDASSAPSLVTAPISVLPAPTFISSSTIPTRENVSVTINYPADASVREYSFNETNWIPYTSAIVMTDNGTIYARWKDPIGVPSSTGVFTVSNINKTALSAPTLSATPTTPTNGNVSVTITYPGDSVQNKYQIGSGAVLDYTGPITLSGNDSVRAYAVD
ncbi:MAG: coagulation factor 5/8 type protein, partial [Paenibacillus sp.]|nr:coagulation factor 5/8 type protein [Paenibacillus sp.]